MEGEREAEEGPRPDRVLRPTKKVGQVASYKVLLQGTLVYALPALHR